MDQKIKGLIISYLEGTTSAKEEKLLVKWLKNNPEHAYEAREMYEIWNLSELEGKFDAVNLEKEWINLLQKVNESMRSSRSSISIVGYWIPRVAAVFLLGAIMAFAISYQVFNVEDKDLVYHEISSPAGAKSKVTLPDGSSIWLNAGSTLRYSNVYGKKTREVSLTGEAFFDVVTNKSKMFLVKTSDLNIKAYGTSFNVKSYPEENTVETTLIEGSVGVTRTRFSNKKNDEVMLEPNQRVVYYKPLQKTKIEESELEEEKVEPAPVQKPQQKLTYMISRGIDPEPFTSWRDGILVITSETLQKLAIKLERKYDVKIHFEDSEIKNFKFTGALENETIEQVIEAIGMAAKINYEIDERDIVLTKQ